MNFNDIVQSELNKIYRSNDEFWKLSYSTSLLRSVLQAACVAVIEVAMSLVDDDNLPLNTNERIFRFHKPSDGILLEILDSLIPCVKSIDRQFCIGWFEPVQKTPLCTLILSWVESRNQDAHEVTDFDLAKRWASENAITIELCKTVFKDFFEQKIGDDGIVTLDKKYDGLILKTPILIKHKLFVVRNIKCNKGEWYLNAKLVDEVDSVRQVVALSASNPLVLRQVRTGNRFDCLEVMSESGEGAVLTNLPARQTSVFEGRKSEFEKIHSWLGENQQRACLIFGDGGVGKTTLVLEYFNAWLDGEIALPDPLPEVVCYYSAKMTQWTDHGLTYIKSTPEALEQCLRELVYSLESTLSKSWFLINGDKLLSKVETELRRCGINRDQVLLIIDNTETFVNSTSDLDEFTGYLKKISIKIGRVLLTSRRREQLAFEPIPVSELSESETVRLLRRLARQHGANPILQAGDARLRRIGEKLSRKPLLLDALVKYIARSDLGIDDALDQLFPKNNEQLQEFLYEDAWARMTESQRDVFMVLSLLLRPIDSFTVSRACQLVKMPTEDFHLSMDEAYFCTVIDHGESFDVNIGNLALDFFQRQVGKLDKGKRHTINGFVEDIHKQVDDRKQVNLEFKKDRVDEAFRSQAAKQAKIEASKGDIISANEYFLMAVKDDPLNASLCDRYAWFLLHKYKDTFQAREWSDKALTLSPYNADALLTRGLISYRENKIREGDEFLDRSFKHGKAGSLIALRKAIARFHAARDASAGERKMALLDSARKFLVRADRELKYDDPYYQTNKVDIIKYRHLIEGEFSKSRRYEA